MYPKSEMLSVDHELGNFKIYINVVIYNFFLFLIYAIVIYFYSGAQIEKEIYITQKLIGGTEL